MTTSSHYEAHSPESYEEAYFYEAGTYQQYLIDLVGQRLQLSDSSTQEERHILDIGGGTGNFAQALLEGAPQNTRITVVDPFLDPTKSTTDDEATTNLAFVKAPAEDFLKAPSNDEKDTWRRQGFHQVLLKEVVHHLEDKDRVGIFQGMYQELIPTPSAPSVLIITRPQTEIDYPLWDAAREVWKKNQPSVDEFSKELLEAGFCDIQHTLEPYPCQIALSRWQSMVKNRFWSTFSNFSDEELREACAQMEVDYQDRVDDQGILHFEDRLVFLSARKIE